MRISRPHMFMQMAEVAAMRATCYRGNVGALVVSQNDIVSVGYNGPASGLPHCTGEGCARTEEGGCLSSIHAERNAILRALSKLKISSLAQYSVYCTAGPCLKCAELMFNSYMRRLFYRHSYRDPAGLQYFIDSSKYNQAYRVMPSGILISERTGKIIDAADIS